MIGCKLVTEILRKLYHVTENIANQNKGQPLSIRRYCIHPSHHAYVALVVVVAVFYMAWYKIVEARLCTEKIQVTRGTFNGIQLDSVE